jgi:ABC-type multidrug transport system fused ATPase/permease subunit
MALERVRELFDLPEEKEDKEIVLPERIEEIAFEDVHFAYDKDTTETQTSKEKNYTEDNQVLKGISFTARRGEKIGIVGSSGGGKTTLLRLLAGLYEISDGNRYSHGAILVNGRKLSTEELIALRKKVAIVEQEPYLFNDTVYNNIRFGNVRASEEAIYSAAKKAYADGFIRQLADGYDTIVGERGANLSVGEKQRVAIARALVKRPSILVLDEATSNIDSLSEEFINRTIFSLPDDMIVFIIAHRLYTVKQCDRILVLENGRIVEQGTHNELILLGGYYARFQKAYME